MDFSLGFSFSPLAALVSQALFPDFEASYVPSWASNYTFQTQDADGWTVVEPSNDSRIMYVSEAGNDGTGQIYAKSDFADWENPAGEAAFLTIAAAAANMRDGYPDYVLVKRGEAVEWLSTYQHEKSGRNNSEPQVFGVYGASGAMPVIKMQADPALRIWDGCSYLNIMLWDVYGYQRDPSSGDYVGAKNVDDALFIESSGGNTANTDILIEGCKFHWLNHVITTAGVRGTGWIIRRCGFFDMYHPNTARRTAGYFLSGTEVLSEENYYDKCGWLNKLENDGAYTTNGALSGAAVTSVVVNEPIASDAQASGAIFVKADSGNYHAVNYTSFTGSTFAIESTDFSGDPVSDGNECYLGEGCPTIYNHSVYAQGIQNSIFRNELSLRPSSIHHKFSSNTSNLTLATTLSGAAETSVVLSSAPGKLPTGSHTITIVTDGAAEVEIEYTSRSGTTLTIPATDFSGDNATAGNTVKPANFVNSENVAYYKQVLVDGELMSSFGGNDDQGDGARFSNFQFSENIGCYIGRGQHTHRTLGIGLEADDNVDLTLYKNYNIHTDNVAVTNTNVFNVKGFANTLTVTDNQAYDLGGPSPFGFNPLSQTQSEITSYGNVGDLDASYYNAPTRTIEAYLTSIGETATLDALGVLLRAQNKFNWDDRLTPQAIWRYLREGFALSPGVIVLNQPNNVTVPEAEEISLTFDTLSEYPRTFQWFDASDDSAVSGQTSAQFSKVASISDNGLQVYCVATDTNGASVTSDTVTISVSEPRQYLTFNGGVSKASFTSVTVANGDEVSFKFNTSQGFFNILGESSTSTQYFRLWNNGNQLRVRLSGTSLEFNPGYNLANGEDHTVVFSRNGSGVPTCHIDGVLVPEANGASNSNSRPFNQLPLQQTSNEWYTGSVWDLRFVIGGEETFYAIDSGSTTTESASVGTGTMTFSGVLAGDWS